MTRLYLEFFYYHSIPEMLLWGVLLTAFWTALALLLTRKNRTKAWIWTNKILLAVVILFILYWTVGKRGTGTKQEISLLPFHSFIAAQSQPEWYREVVANILLFIPLGLSMPFVIYSCPKKERWWTYHPVHNTILFAAILSLAIELVQFIFGLGLAETDDILANALEAAIGTLSFVYIRRHPGFTPLFNSGSAGQAVS